MGMATAGISAGLGIYNAIRGAKEQHDAKVALDNYQRQQLNNAYDNMQVSTRGADLQREEASRLASEQVDALQGGGTRALVGGLGRVETGNQRVNLGIGANLDEQQKAIDQAKAEDDARIRQMIEARQNQDINALSSQYQAGKNDMNMGFGNIVQGFGSMQNQMNFDKWLKTQNPTSTPIQPLQKMSATQPNQLNSIQTTLLPQQYYPIGFNDFRNRGI